MSNFLADKPRPNRMVLIVLMGTIVIASIAGWLLWRNLHNHDTMRQFAFARFDTDREYQAGLGRLKRDNPEAYLDEIRLKKGDTAWLVELAILNPAKYRAEMSQREREDEARRATEADTQRNGTDCVVSLSQYLALRTGDSYSTVQNALGCNGTELSRARFGRLETTMYMWKGGLFGNMNATFQNGRLIGKAQFGLR